MERRKFEDAFRNAFQDAEITPGDSVWTNVELDLARAEGSRMKRRVLFYQLLAAASISFALCVVGVGYYTYQNQNAGLVAVNGNLDSNTVIPDTVSLQRRQHEDRMVGADDPDAGKRAGNRLSSPVIARETTDHEVQNVADISPADAKISRPQYSGSGTPDGVTGSRGTDGEVIARTEQSRGNNQASSESAGLTFEADRSLPALYVHKIENPRFVKPSVQTEPNAAALMLASLKDREQQLAQADDRDHRSGERMWTSVGFSAGNFTSPNPHVSGSATAAISAGPTNKAVTNQARASGTSYAMGLAFGTRVSDRWVIQGGVNYMTQVSDYTSTVAVSSTELNYFKAASLNEFRDADGDTYVPTAPYNVNNSVRYISVPLQAGYLLLDRQFGVQMNAGVSTDMFLQNTIDPEGTMEKTTVGRGDESPYRPVNFSGLVGTEISYRFADRYRLSLNPGLRYPFRSIYKDEMGIDSAPLTFDIGLRFRYIFH